MVILWWAPCCTVDNSDLHDLCFGYSHGRRVGKLCSCWASTWFDHWRCPRRPQNRQCRRCSLKWCPGLLCDPWLQFFLGLRYSILGWVDRGLLPGPVQNHSLLLFRQFVSLGHLYPSASHGVDLAIRVGHIILVGTSVPSSLAHPNGALAGLIVSVIIMGIGAGSIKANVSPMVAEQYTGKLRKRTLPSGEVVLVSPALTYQRIYLCKFLEHNLVTIFWRYHRLDYRLLRCYQRRGVWGHLLIFHCS